MYETKKDVMALKQRNPYLINIKIYLVFYRITGRIYTAISNNEFKYMKKQLNYLKKIKKMKCIYISNTYLS